MKQFKSISCALVGALSLLSLGSIAHASGGIDDKAITVFKTPWCGCCQVWIEAMQKAGYTVETNDLDDLSNIKQQAEVPKHLEACHTAVIGGARKYVLEGHVPIAAVEKLQAENPKIRGISTPGMPTGSLGMGFDEEAEYTVYAYLNRADEKSMIFFEAGKTK
jgi:hypothetical protein